MSARMVSPAGSCLLTVAVLLAGGLLFSEVASAAPDPTAGAASYHCLPCDSDGGLLFGPLDEDMPPRMRTFLEITGVDWNVFWDRVLETPTLVYPHDPYELPEDPDAEPLDPDEEPILKDVRAFVETHRDFLGIGPEGLAPLYVRPFADGLHVSALQMHQGLPIRGSAFRMLINADRTIRSVDNLLARDLPPVDTGTLDILAIAAVAEEDGLERILHATPQVVFPGEWRAPLAACAVVGVDGGGQEVEALYSTVSGERIAARATALHLDGPCEFRLHLEGTLRGHYPDPEEVCTTPLDFSPDLPYPIVGAEIIVDVPGACASRLSRWSDETGFFSATVADVGPDPAYTVRLNFGNRHFELRNGDPRYIKPSFELEGAPWVPPEYNTEREEYQSFHLMATHHLRKATKETAAWVNKYEVAWNPRLEPISLELTRNDYTYLFNPFKGSLILGSDELEPRNAQGRLRKMVPTIIYHEYGHEFIGRLSGEVLPTLAHEGVADVVACYIAKTGTLGYANDDEPNADTIARDLMQDTSSYPAAPRTTISGAFWELWDATLAVPQPDQWHKPRESPFAQGLLTRWLAANWVRGPVGVGGRTIQSNPRLGHALYLLADHESLGGDNILRNGFRFDEQLILAFGRRNLFQFRFIRGDANADGSLDLSDAVTILGYLFLGETDTTCLKAFDSDDSGNIDLSDAVVLLTHLFLGGPALPRPFPHCSYEQTLDDGLGCWGGACGFISPGW